MTILVIGATGRVGRHVVEQLVARDASVRVLTRDPTKAAFPAGVDVAKGDLLDIDSLRGAFVGVRTLFLLNAVTGDEFTQAIVTLNVAREAGVDRVVYLSVFDADRAVNVPHFAVKSGAERMLEAMNFGATILRPTYFIDNEAMVKDVILQHGVYPMPIGGKGVAMVDARDIAEVAAIELIRRDRAPDKLPIRYDQRGWGRDADGRRRGSDMVRRPRPPRRLRRQRSQRLRTEHGGVHAALDGL